MSKLKLMHIMVGVHNPMLQIGLDSVFDCFHFNWRADCYTDKRNVLNIDFLRIFYEFKPDIVFMHTQEEGVLSLETILTMKAGGAKIYNWTGDVRQPTPSHYIELARHIDSTLFTNLRDVEVCRDAGWKSDFLQVGFDSEHFNPTGNVSNAYPEILFLGSNYKGAFPLSGLRSEMVERLKKEFGNNFGVYGNNWDSLGNGTIDSYQEEATAYRSCKIAINLSHFAYPKYT